MRKKTVLLVFLLCILGIAGCLGQSRQDPGAETAETVSVKGADSYKIGVIVYSNTDEEVLAIREYLENYIAEVFPGITFVYSDSISTEEEELDFIQKSCDQGVDGFLSFLSMNLPEEVKLCEQNKAYYILASGTVSDKDFKAVEDNPYFIGAVGPGEEMEYQTGADMAKFFTDHKEGNRYFILSGGAGIGNEMHLQRTIGILDTLQKAYGVSFDQTSEEIARSGEPVHVSAGDLTVCVTPGYISSERFLSAAKEEYQKDQYKNVLSVLPIADMANVVKNSRLGVIDCYTSGNLELFNNGQLCYVAGKYGAIVGPSFAAMYNAVTGYAEDFRENGKAFKLTQGFWCSTDSKDYEEKYSMATSVVTNAYNYEDLGKVCKVFDPDANLKELEDLISAYTYEDAKARRNK
ncbi:MAG: hypothetical protein IJH71_04150 [Eubacterium sp.]|nr:hypothetical protein [Eubacterium sp.]